MTLPRSAPRSATRLANDTWESVLTAHARIMRHLAATDIWHPVSMREYDVLYTLSKCADPVRQRELAQHVLLSQPALSRLLDRLVERGLVHRDTDPADRRAVLHALTDDGRAAQRAVGARHAMDVAAMVTDRLTPAEMQQLEGLARKLAGQVNGTNDD